MLLSERKNCKNKMGIYKITNTITGTSYVGQATNIALRIYQHLHSAISDKASDYDYPLHKAIRKYGADNFVFEILEECDNCMLNERERYWVAFYDTFKSGYNQTAGGYQSIRQIKLTESDVEQIRDRLLNTDDSFANIAQDFNVCSDMVGRINKGICWNNLAFNYPLRNNRAVQIKKRLDTGLGVYQLDKKTGEVLNIFVSASQAALYLGSQNYSINIGRCLSGKRKVAYGYQWEARPVTQDQFKELIQRANVSEAIKQLV
jgi:group I intron endonuclease